MPLHKSMGSTDGAMRYLMTTTELVNTITGCAQHLHRNREHNPEEIGELETLQRRKIETKMELQWG